jgi:outer membrane receptor protein involved in Fe transport
VRVDYVPEEGQLLSASWFSKNIDQPIENVQQIQPFDYTTVVNYPKGTLAGYEFEVRQSLGTLVEELDGLSVGANATFIKSQVDLPASEIQQLKDLEVPITSRDMTNAPDHLYNVYLTYDIANTGTQFALFYTIKGDTLVAGAGEAGGSFVPSVYEKEYGTVNFSITQELSERTKLQFQAKNLTNPSIEQVYRSDFIANDVTKTSYTRGREFSLGVSIRF